MSHPSSDSRPTEELIAEVLKDPDSESASQMISVLQGRGTIEEFTAAVRLVFGDEDRERALGARILGQLGLERRSFHIQSVALLIMLLEDRAPLVIASAAVALGQRQDDEAVPYLERLADHADAGVRQAVTTTLDELTP